MRPAYPTKQMAPVGGGDHRPGPRPIRHIGSEGAVDLHPSCTPRYAPGQGMHIVKVAISQEIPSTLPLVQGRAKHVRKEMAHRTRTHTHRGRAWATGLPAFARPPG